MLEQEAMSLAGLGQHRERQESSSGPFKTESYNLEAAIKAVAIKDRIAYCATWNKKITQFGLDSKLVWNRWPLNEKPTTVELLGKKLLVTGDLSGKVRLFDIEAEKVTQTFKQDGRITAIKATENQTLVAASSEGQVYLYNNERYCGYIGLSSEYQPTALATRQNIVAVGTESGFVAMYDIRNPSDCYASIQADQSPINTMTFSDHHCLLGTKSGLVRSVCEGWNGNKYILYKGLSVKSLMSFPSGTATGLDNGTISFWKPEGKASVNFKLHRGCVTALAVVGPNKILSAGYDGMLKIHHTIEKSEV